MKKAIMIVLALLVCLAFVATTFAQEKSTPSKADRTKGMHFRGEVTNVDSSAKTITVKGKEGEMTFDISGAKMKGEVKAGDKVSVAYTEQAGKNVARWVGTGKHRDRGTKGEMTPSEPAQQRK